MPTPKSKPTPKSWRDIPDASHNNPLTSWPSPESLSPGPQTSFAAVCGNPEAKAIIDGYAFRFPVTIVASLEVCP